MNFEQIKQLVDYMRSAGVDVFKFAELEVKFSPALKQESLEPTPEERRAALMEMLKSESEDKDADELWSV